jgi:hypothetical protein
MCEPVSIAALLTGAYQVYKACKLGSSVISWAEIHDKVSSAEYAYAELENSKPRNTSLAKNNGYYDMRRKPAPSMRKAIAELKAACGRKDEGMLWTVLKKMAPGGEFADIAEEAGDDVEDIF